MDTKGGMDEKALSRTNRNGVCVCVCMHLVMLVEVV
jgi:hypothetical protein